MSLKATIVAALDRDDLKRVLDALDIDGVDRRNVQAMRSAITGSRRVSPELLLDSLPKQSIQQVCGTLGLSRSGGRGELVERILGDGKQEKPPAQRSSKMAQEEQSGNGSLVTTAPVTKKPPKLTLPRLERKLFDACDILRGNMDASEYKEYIFGMLFLKRLSDQFERDREKLRTEYTSKGMKPDLIEKQLANPDKYDFFVPEEARWSATDKEGRNIGIAHLKTEVGSGLNKALAAIEDANIEKGLEDVLKHINFNKKVGQRTMDDSTLIEFIQEFDEIPLSNDDFEFPDLLGAAYEYLIKYFADSAGKKGGEFYTPAEVVRLMVQIIEPQEGMTIYDPTVGSGGMLIQSKQYVQETGGDSRNLELAGQELNGGTWAICKMNMLLHGILSADIRQGDTLKDPQHLDKNSEIRRFHRVIANPPFAQPSPKESEIKKFKERFPIFTSGKKADLMFVQHMVASLRSDGKLAVVMPHGVLFRGGEEKACRQRFIKEGILETIIGLPAGLFYGTGIPACILVLNKHEAKNRTSILFINADRECREGKNQNSLRPEDIEKITHVYRNRLTVEKYSRVVPVSELENEGFNLSIRRYVDNSPPPEPHDVRAHLHGGIPVAEIAELDGYFGNYSGTKKLLFRDRDAKYSDFAAGIDSKDDIKRAIESAPGVDAKHTEVHAALDKWWKKNLPEIERLPDTQNVFGLRRHCIDSLPKTLVPLAILDVHQVRGAVASYMKSLESDFKSVAASGWGAELIPEEDILKSQFPDVLAQIEKDQARLAELQAMFAAVNEGEEEDADAEPVETENGILPKSLVKTLKEERKALAGEVKEIKKKVKQMRQDAKRRERTGELFGSSAELETEASDTEAEGVAKSQRIEEIDSQLAKHSALEGELRKLKANLREVEKKKDQMIAAARAKISEDEAKGLILERFQRLLAEQFDGYLRQYQRGLIAAVENFSEKYAVTTKQILAERDQEAAQLNLFLKELGYD